MENAKDALNVAEMKEESIGQVLDQVQQQVSSFFAFALQWKDLQNHLELAKSNLSKQAQDLALQEMKIVETTKVLEQRDKDVETKLKGIEACFAELELKKKQLAFTKKWIEECTLELNSKEKQLKEARKEVENCHEMLNVGTVQLSMTKVELEDCNREVKEKWQQLSEVHKSIQESVGELELKNSKLVATKGALEECCEDLLLKEEQKSSVQNSLDKCCEELEFKRKELHDLKNSITDCNSELELKAKKLNVLQNLVEKCDGDLDVKGEELKATQALIEECRNELNLKQKEKDGTAKLIEEQLRVVNLKEKELSEIQEKINQKSEDLGSKEKLLDSIKELIKENNEELAIKEKQHEAIKASIVVRCTDFKVKGEELEFIEKSIEKRQTELHSMDKQLDALKRFKEQLSKELLSKMEELESVKKKFRSYCEELKLKERDLHACDMSRKELMRDLNTKEKLLKSEEKKFYLARNSLKECRDELESEKAQLESVQKTSCELSKALEEKGRHFDSLKMAFLQRLEEFQVKEIQFVERVKRLELKEKHFDSMKRSVEEHGKEVELKQKLLNDSLHLRIVINQHENFTADIDYRSASLECCIPSDGANLQLVLNQHLKMHDLVLNEVRVAIQSSSDPAKLVLDAMQGFHPLALNSGKVEFDMDIIRRSCITLLKLLCNISPMIEPQVRGKAMQLAVEWRARMRAMPENSLEVLAFLQLLAAFKLSSAFSAVELRSLLDVIKQRGQDPVLRQGLGITDNLVGGRSPVCSSSANLQSDANSTEGISQPVQFDCVGEQPSAHQEIFAALKFSTDPAKLVLNVMQGFRRNENTSFDASSLSSKVILLEQLMAISANISPSVKEEALGLALLWEAKMRSEAKNSMEVLGFLLFLAIYGLAPHFKRDHIFGLIGIVLEHKQAAEICQALGLVVPAGCLAALEKHCSDQPQLQRARKRPRSGNLADPRQCHS